MAKKFPFADKVSFPVEGFVAGIIQVKLLVLPVH